MVEPLLEYAADLAPLVAPTRVDYIQAAAGAGPTELPLLIPDNPGGSSFLPSSRETDRYFKRSVTVPVVTLDSLNVPPGTCLLKLDVQGYELQALAGASRLLADVEVLITECSLYPFQRDIPLVDDVMRHVAELGFRLYDIADETRWRSGTLAQVDMVFVDERSDLRSEQRWRELVGLESLGERASLRRRIVRR